jgi:hypothetical protein
VRSSITRTALGWLSIPSGEKKGGSSARRAKSSAIVALARKLLVALWKYVSAGIVIEGAVMKSAA